MRAANWKRLVGLVAWFGIVLLVVWAKPVEQIVRESTFNEEKPTPKPPVDWPHTHKSHEMVAYANYLRKLGKTEYLALLRHRLNPKNEEFFTFDATAHYLCRLLFVNPEGWEAPRLGQPIPECEEETRKKFELFPIGFSNGVPFVLIYGHRLRGFGEPAINAVDMCERFEMIDFDYPTVGHEEAADLLVNSEAFQHLYQADDLEEITAFILKQAKP